MGSARLDITVPLRSFDLAVTLAVGAETVALVGPSGAGKTTVLKAVAGLVRPSRGRISSNGTTWFDSRGKVNRRPEQRPVGYVLQEYALFPHLTVEKNVSFAGGDRRDLLERLGIEQLAKAKPGELSGGERQRVAIARALARRPEILLLDEPMAALDPHTRGRVRAELRTLLRELALPAILVTHDFVDAAAVADRIAVLVDGRIVQTGTAEELIAAPSSPFVAELAGGNLLTRERARAGGRPDRGRARRRARDRVDGRGLRAGRSRRPSMGDLDLARGDEATRPRTTCARRSRASSRSATAAGCASAR